MTRSGKYKCDFYEKRKTERKKKGKKKDNNPKSVRVKINIDQKGKK